MSKAVDRPFGHYNALDSTKAFLAELSSDIVIPISHLVQVIKGGDATQQGDVGSPSSGINLAHWLSPKIQVQVSKWVLDWMSGKGRPAKLPFHLERHMLNLHKIPTGHFSVLQEMTNALVAPMEAQG